MADFLITSLRGGQSEDMPISLAEDQCIECTNVEFDKSMLGERRLGAEEIDLSGSDLASCDEVVWMFRHYPSPDSVDVQFWALGINTSPASATFAYKDATGWHTVVPDDAIDTSDLYTVTAVTLHGKLYIAYNSSVDRLHVWDGTSLRRVGLAAPAAPVVADDGGAGTYSGTRYFRVRYVTLSGTTVLRRSEPSDSTEFTPNGNDTGANISKPAAINEGETHWEVEGSLDNTNFYRIARVVVATSTYNDQVVFSSGYANATDAVLSEDIGDYTLIPSVRFLTVVDDRLMVGGSFEDDELASRVQWTPVLNADGVGNDERLEADTDPSVDLDNYEGGRLTGLSTPLSGYVFATKNGHIYQLNKSGVRTAAYEVNVLTKSRGAIEGSMTSATDNLGNPTLFALDPDIGPIRFSPRGVEPCGLDLFKTWERVNLDAATVPARVVFYHEKMQVHWFVPLDGADIPTHRLVLHTEEMREAADGTRRGWVVWDGPSAAALSVCMFSDNLDDFASGASNHHVPYIGVAGDGLIWKTDIGSDDNGTEYTATIVTKPYVKANLINKFIIMSASIYAEAEADAMIDVTVTGMRLGQSVVSKNVPDVDFTPVAGEGDFVIRHLDNLSQGDMNTMQFTFEDTTPQGTGQWSLGLMAIRLESGQKL